MQCTYEVWAPRKPTHRVTHWMAYSLLQDTLISTLDGIHWMAKSLLQDTLSSTLDGTLDVAGHTEWYTGCCSIHFAW